MDCSHRMRTFSVNLVGEELEVLQNGNGTYTVSNQGGILGDLWLEDTEHGTIWMSVDLSKDFAEQIGELIEERNL
jgi:hypothetical protein